MLEFDEKGHLIPYEVIELTLKEFEAFFVEGLDDWTHRRRLFQNYLRYLEALKTIVETPFFQWVDGSFVTLNAQPQDFDVLTFLEHDVYVAKKQELTWLKADARIDWEMDANFAFTCPKSHTAFVISLEIQEFWRNLYGFSRMDVNYVKHPKGIIRLNFE